MVESSYKQTFIGIWLHDNSLPSDQQDKMQLILNQTFYYYRIFVNQEDFYTYIDEERLVAKIVLIISTSDLLLDSLVELAEQYPDIFIKVYTFPSKKISTSTCFNTNNMDELFHQMNRDIQNYISKTNPSSRAEDEVVQEYSPNRTCLTNRPAPSFSVFNPKIKQRVPIRHLTRESLNFLCFLTMTEILCQISAYSPEELSEMWSICRKINGNDPQLDRIDEFKDTYKKYEAIKYYTGNSCLSRTINQACHTENMKYIYTFRPYISDLHEELVKCHEQGKTDGTTLLIEQLYRGKPLSGSVLQQFIDNIGGLVSMNGFLSTSISRDVAVSFAGVIEQMSDGQKSILFMLEIDKQIRQPYAYIGNCSEITDELEVLFSLGTVWYIKSIKLNENPCIIQLASCDELDSQLIELLKKYTENGYNLSSVGDILYELGNNDEAEWFYHKILKQDNIDNNTRGSLYYKIGKIRFDKKDYKIALQWFEDAAKLLPTSINESDNNQAPRPLYASDSRSALIAIYYNMGTIHEEDGEFKKAVYCYKQALEVNNGPPSEIAIVHNKLGLLLFSHSEYEEAREHYTKAIKLTDESHSKWIEFNKNLDRANQRCQHLTNKNQNC